MTLVILQALIPLFLWSLVISPLGYFLAKEKGRKATKWALLGAIPIFNFGACIFFVGAANWRLENKIDELLRRSQQ